MHCLPPMLGRERGWGSSAPTKELCRSERLVGKEATHRVAPVSFARQWSTPLGPPVSTGGRFRRAFAKRVDPLLTMDSVSLSSPPRCSGRGRGRGSLAGESLCAGGDIVTRRATMQCPSSASQQMHVRRWNLYHRVKRVRRGRREAFSVGATLVSPAPMDARFTLSSLRPLQLAFSHDLHAGTSVSLWQKKHLNRLHAYP